MIAYEAIKQLCVEDVVQDRIEKIYIENIMKKWDITHYRVKKGWNNSHNPKVVGAVSEARKSPWGIRVLPPQPKKYEALARF